MNESEKYLTVKQEIPFNINDNYILDIRTNNVTSSTHGFHKYPAKFIPQIPKWAILKYLKVDSKKCILDPFCGSGTTLVEGVLAGHNVIGIDIDPLSILISKVKTTPLKKIVFLDVYEWVKNIIQSKNSPNDFNPECLNIRHWFTDENIDKLSKIRTTIDKISTEFKNKDGINDVQDFFYVAFSSIIRRVSNADNESQKTYVSHTKIKIPEEPIELFFNQLNLYKERILKFSENVNSDLTTKLYCEDSSRPFIIKRGDFDIDIVITSPPYIKAIDYIYNQMAELFWIGDLFELQTQDRQNIQKKKYVGSKHFHKKDYEHFSPFDSLTQIQNLDKKLQDVLINDKKNGHKHSYLTHKYFNDMEKHFQKMSDLLKKKKHYIMVVGDSTVSDVFFNTADILTKIASRNGFYLTNRWAYKIKNRYMRFDRKGRGGIIKLDWVLDFVKT
ncbi:site-specific DNA-methyltransferase [candidate division KSB1 bacterium]|nr:site-specific DNA-methyltransferase [candidate division KSB1 bacterium]